MVNARYRNKKNGRVATVVQEDQKYKTVLIKYEDTEEEQQVSSSTLKRWWEELDEDDEALDDVDVEDDDDEEYEDDDEEEYEDDDDEEYEDDDEEEVVDDEDLAGDGTPLKEVGKQIARQAKEKAAKAKEQEKAPKPVAAAKEKKSHRKLEANPEVDDIFVYIQQAAAAIQAEAYVRNAQPSLYNYKVPSMKSVAFLVYKSRNRVELHCKAKQIDEKLASKLEQLNHVFDRRLVIKSLTADAKKTIDSIIKTYAQEQGTTKKAGKKGEEAK